MVSINALRRLQRESIVRHKRKERAAWRAYIDSPRTKLHQSASPTSATDGPKQQAEADRLPLELSMCGKMPTITNPTLFLLVVLLERGPHCDCLALWLGQSRSPSQRSRGFAGPRRRLEIAGDCWCPPPGRALSNGLFCRGERPSLDGCAASQRSQPHFLACCDQYDSKHALWVPASTRVVHRPACVASYGPCAFSWHAGTHSSLLLQLQPNSQRPTTTCSSPKALPCPARAGPPE